MAAQQSNQYAFPDQESALCRCSPSLTLGPGHRLDHRHFQRRPHRSAAAAALSRSRPPGGGAWPEHAQFRYLPRRARQLSGLEAAEPRLRIHVRHLRVVRRSHRTRALRSKSADYASPANCSLPWASIRCSAAPSRPTTACPARTTSSSSATGSGSAASAPIRPSWARTLTLNSESYTVVGIMPRGFAFPLFWATNAQMWAPVSFPPGASRSAAFLRSFARLKPGVSLEQARSEMDTIARRLEADYPAANTVDGHRRHRHVRDGGRQGAARAAGDDGAQWAFCC